MSDHSTIEWTDATWNPVVGCDRISPGCAYCYAKAIHDRRHKSFLAGGNVLVPQYAKPFEVVRPREDRLDVPLHWKKPRRVFVNSMSDLFHDDVPGDFIMSVFAVMALCPQHTFQVLTKRPKRMQEICSDPMTPRRVAYRAGPNVLWPLPNVWLGVSVENQHFADERIPLLLQTPSAVRFISAEPLLGPVNLNTLTTGTTAMGWINALRCVVPRHLDWVIVGGESGPGARPFNIEWARSIVAQCHAAGVPVFVKQLGSNPAPLRVDAGSVLERLWLRDRKGGDPEEWPIDLRVRQWPAEP